MIEISRNIMLLCVMFALIVMKGLGYDSIIDDMLVLAIGAILGKEVLTEKKKDVPAT